MKFEWEQIHQRDSQSALDGTQRAKVIGGWLVRTLVLATTKTMMQMVFVSDPNHEWKIEK